MKLNLLYTILISTLQVQQTNSKKCNPIDICNGINILELTIENYHNLYTNKRQKLSSYQLTKCYLNRIKHYNPILNAVIETNNIALKQARKLDTYYKLTGKLIGDLHGVPVLVKDNIGTVEGGMHTTAGSYALLNAIPNKEAEVVRKLKEAGAIILGKSNLSEFAGFRSEKDLAGWSGRGLQTNNPYWLNGTTSGSSSGSAVAVSANLCLVALGTETDGSIIAPSSLTATVGIKPSVGFTSGFGVIPLAPSQDSVGVISRNVDDGLIVLKVIGEEKLKKVLNSAKCVNHKNLRVGVIRDPYFNQTLVKEELPFLNASLISLSKKLTLIDNLTIVEEAIIYKNEHLVILSEFKHNLNNYLLNNVTHSSNNNKIDSISKIIQFNKDYPNLELNKFDQSLLVQAETSLPINHPEHLLALNTNRNTTQSLINNLLRDNNLDGLIVPSHYILGAYSIPAIAGYPIVTVPIGVLNNQTEEGKVGKGEVPFGLSVYGTVGSESKILMIAKLIEMGSEKRPLPSYKP